MVFLNVLYINIVLQSFFQVVEYFIDFFLRVLGIFFVDVYYVVIIIKVRNFIVIDFGFLFYFYVKGEVYVNLNILFSKVNIGLNGIGLLVYVGV